MVNVNINAQQNVSKGISKLSLVSLILGISAIVFVCIFLIFIFKSLDLSMSNWRFLDGNYSLGYVWDALGSISMYSIPILSIAGLISGVVGLIKAHNNKLLLVIGLALNLLVILFIIFVVLILLGILH